MRAIQVTVYLVTSKLDLGNCPKLTKFTKFTCQKFIWS